MASYFGRRFFTAWSFLVYCTFFFLAAVLRFFTCSRTSWFFITNICSVFSLLIFCLLLNALVSVCLRLVSSLRILCSVMFSRYLTRYVCRHTSLIFSAYDAILKPLLVPALKLFSHVLLFVPSQYFTDTSVYHPFHQISDHNILHSISSIFCSITSAWTVVHCTATSPGPLPTPSSTGVLTGY